MKKVFFLLIFALTMPLLLSAAAVSPVPAADLNALPKLSQRVRVAFPVQQGMTFFKEDGKRSGYTYEYLQEIAQYSEWTFDFVDFTDNDDNVNLLKTLQMLKDGELDVAGGWSYSMQTAQEYGFYYSSHSYGSVETVLQASYQSGKDFVINSQIEQTFKIAVIEGAERTIKEIQEYCQVNRITPEFVYCATMEEQYAALNKDENEAGYAELMANSSMNYIEGVHTVARFAAKPFYFIVSKKANPAILQELDAAMIKIDSASPLLASSLFKKYFSPDTYAIQLNEDERKFIDEQPSVEVGLLITDAPYQYLNSSSKPSGIAIDLLNKISLDTGLSFSYKAYSDYDALVNAVSDGSVRAIAALTYDYELAANYGVSLTRSYVESQYVMLSSAALGSGLDGKKQAVSPSDNYRPTNAETVEADSVLGCIEAVLSGKADYTYTDAYCAQYYVTQPKYNSLNFTPMHDEARRLSFGIKKGGNKILLGIINKAITAMSEADLQSVINRNLVVENEITLSYLIRTYPIQAVAVIITLSAVMVASLAFILVIRAKASKKRQSELARHYRLFGLVSESLLEYDHSTKKLVINVPDKNGGNNMTEFDFSQPPADDETALKRVSFLELLNSENGVKDIELYSFDGKMHWFRFALETERKNGAPVYTLGKFTNIDEEKRQESDLQSRAERDSLTRLYNAEATRKIVTEGIEGVKSGTNCSLILVDIDLFKGINDTYGHLQGDAVLIAFAELLGEIFPDQALCRPGGDEFAVCLRGVSKTKLTALCRTLTDKAKEICVREGVMLSVSAGAAVAKADDTYYELYARADKALYSVKLTKRGGFKIDCPASETKHKRTGPLKA